MHFLCLRSEENCWKKLVIIEPVDLFLENCTRSKPTFRNTHRGKRESRAEEEDDDDDHRKETVFHRITP